METLSRFRKFFRATEGFTPNLRHSRAAMLYDYFKEGAKDRPQLIDALEIISAYTQEDDQCRVTLTGEAKNALEALAKINR